MVTKRKRVTGPSRAKIGIGYRWGDRDPHIDMLAQLLSEDTRPISKIAEEAGFSASTLYKIANDPNKTRILNSTRAGLERHFGVRIVNEDLIIHENEIQSVKNFVNGLRRSKVHKLPVGKK